jgi:NTE family protein
MQARWVQGLSDAQKTLLASPWLAPMPPEIGARTFDVLRHNPAEESQSLLQTPHSDKG